MKYIITGGAGFIGSTLIKYLNDRDISNIVIVDLKDTYTTKIENILDLKYKDYIFPETVEMSLFEPGDVLIHLGACTDTQETNKRFMLRNNLDFSKKIMLMASKAGCRIIYASSAGVYGNENYFSDSENIEDFKFLKPTTIYAESKKRLDQWKIQNKINAAGLRFFNVWGNRERYKGRMESIISKKYEDILNGNKIQLFTSKKYPMSRDFIYVNDIIRVIEIFIKNNENGIFNLGTGESITWKFLMEEYARHLEKDCIIDEIELPTERFNNYQFYSKSDNTKLLNLKSMRNFKFTPIETALKDFIDERRKSESKKLF